MPTSTQPDAPAVFEGEISVLAALAGGNRPLHRVLIAQDKPRPETQELEDLARARRVRVERLPRDSIDALSEGRTHGGVIAEAGARRFLGLDDLCAAVPPEHACIIMLDGIEDPFNFGQAVRALFAAGVDGLVVRPRNWMSAAGVVARASAGASELMPTALADDPLSAAAFFRPRGFRIAATARDRRARSLYDATLTPPLFLVIGGEKRGVSREFMEQADLLLKIPYRRRFPHSLGAATSASVIAFELMRQGFVSRRDTGDRAALDRQDSPE
jgi:23S rRNA (guanosine2251-2'-O)-methyltransferase